MLRLFLRSVDFGNQIQNPNFKWLFALCSSRGGSRKDALHGPNGKFRPKLKQSSSGVNNANENGSLQDFYLAADIAT